MCNGLAFEDIARRDDGSGCHGRALNTVTHGGARGFRQQGGRRGRGRSRRGNGGRTANGSHNGGGGSNGNNSNSGGASGGASTGNSEETAREMRMAHAGMIAAAKALEVEEEARITAATAMETL